MGGQAVRSKLAADLSVAGASVWLDEAEIKLGDSLIEKIRSGIDAVDYLAVVLTPRSVASEWVKREVDIAMTQEIRGKRVKVLPLMYKHCDLPGFLEGKLYADFTDPANYPYAFWQLVDRLGLATASQDLGPLPLEDTSNIGEQTTRGPLLARVREKALTRGDVREVRLKYLSRLGSIVSRMHQLLRVHAGDKELIQDAMRQYAIKLGAHLETFFRDILRYVIESDARMFDEVVQKYRLIIPAEGDLAAHGVTRYDYVAEALSLQSAEAVAHALDPLFQPVGFRRAIESTKVEYAVPSRAAVGRGFPTAAFPEWWQDLARTFELRNDFVHDANSIASVTAADMARLEALAVILPQYVVMIIDAQAGVLPTEPGTMLVMFLVEDILATDWVVSES